MPREAKTRPKQEELILIGKRIRKAREERSLTMYEVAERAGITEQQVLRIETAKSEVGVVTLARVARALDKDIGWLVSNVQTANEHIEALWRKHSELIKKRFGDYQDKEPELHKKKTALELLQVWEPICPVGDESSVDGLGYVGGLPARSDLSTVIARLPDTTRIVRMLGISNQYNLEKAPYSRLSTLVRGHQMRIEGLFLDTEKATFLNARVREVPNRWNLKSLRNRIDSAYQQLDLLRRACPKLVTLRRYDRWPIWRLLFVDDERVYVSFYSWLANPLVWEFRRDKDERSVFWTFFRQYLEYSYFDDKPRGSINQAMKRITKEMMEIRGSRR